MKKLLSLILILASAAGCIFGGDTPVQTTYITPCNVIGNGIMFRVNGTNLNTNMIREPISHLFVDDITSDRAANLKPYYTLSCYWGSNIGERKDHYYCNGSYVAPEIDDNGVIVRNLMKSFKIGFSVDESRGETWIDLSGVVHVEPTFYDLTVSAVDTYCIVAWI